MIPQFDPQQTFITFLMFYFQNVALVEDDRLRGRYGHLT